MWGLVIVGAVLVALAAGMALLRRRGEAVTPALFLRRAALIFISACTVLTGVFIAGETFDDPGGWRAAAAVALWLVPLAVLSLLAWYRPAWAIVALGVLLAGLVAVTIWFAADPAWWLALENRQGPVRALAAFILALPAALAAWRRPLAGAVLLLVLGAAPVAISAAGSAHGALSLTAVCVPPLIGGLLYLAAAILGRGAREPGSDRGLTARHGSPGPG